MKWIKLDTDVLPKELVLAADLRSELPIYEAFLIGTLGYEEYSENEVACFAPDSDVILRNITHFIFVKDLYTIPKTEKASVRVVKVNKVAKELAEQKLVNDIIDCAMMWAEKGVSRFVYHFEPNQNPFLINSMVAEASGGSVKCAYRGDAGLTVNYVISK